MKFKRIFSLVLTAAMTAVTVPFPQKQIKALESTKNTENSAISFQGTNSIGEMIGDDIQDAIEEKECESGYVVSGVTIDGNKATIDYSALADCSIVLAIYSNDGQQLLKTFDTKASSDSSSIDIDMSLYDLPQYYYIKAYMVSDGFFRPLSEVYESTLYTEEIQLIKSKCVDDFEEERTVDLDGNNDTNFIVFNENVKLFNSSNAELVSVNSEDKTFTFKDLDHAMLSVKKGDIFAYCGSDAFVDVTIVKVADIEQNGESVVFTGEDSESEEIFDFIKIETSGAAGDAVCDDSEASEGVTLINENEQENYPTDVFGPTMKKLAPIIPPPIDTDAYRPLTLKAKLEFGSDTLKNDDKNKEEEKESGFESGDIKRSTEWSVKGTVSVTLDPKIDFYLSLERQYIKVLFKYIIEENIAFEVEFKLEFILGTLRADVIPGVISVSFKPSIYLTFTGSFEYSKTTSGQIGFELNHEGIFGSKPKINNLTRNPKTEYSLSGNFTLEIGLKLSFEASIATIFTVKVIPSFAYVIESKKDVASMSNFKKHLCDTCFEGEMKYKLDVTISIGMFQDDLLKSLKIFDKLAAKLTLSRTLWKQEFNKKEFHINGNDSFKWGKCPNYKYRVDVIVKNSAGKPISGAKVTTYEGKTLKTNLLGIAEVWLGYGGNTLNINKDGFKSIMLPVYVDDSIETEATLYPEQNSLDEPDKTRSFNYNGHSYYVYEDKASNYEEARDYCHRLGGELVNINDADENAFVAKLIKAFEYTDAYIGAHRNSSNKFVNADNSALEYENWSANQPLRGGTYAKIDADTGEWQQIQTINPNTLRFVCEWTEEDGSIFLNSDYTENNGHGYKIYESGIGSFDWKAAEQFCRSMGGHLACINNASEQEFIVNSLIKDYMKKNPDCSRISLGGFKNRDGKDWHWVDETDFTYTNWSDGQPDCLGGEETVLEIYTQSADYDTWIEEAYHWNDHSGGAGIYFMCEWEDTSKAPESEKRFSKSNSTSTASVNMTRYRSSAFNATAYESDLLDRTGSAEYTGLVPGELYNLYVMCSKNSPEPLSDSNLLYIDQFRADENGNAVIDYIMKNAYLRPDVFVVSASQPDISDAVITVSDVELNGEEGRPVITVKYGDLLLSEGVDYVLCGEYAAAAAGEYTVEIRGIGAYAGTVSKVYTANGNGPSVKYGDANLDGRVSLTDAVAILQFIANKDKYDLSAAGKVNADCYNTGDGITGNDALTIQKVDAGLIEEYELPVL